jgi:hypothetical protein
MYYTELWGTYERDVIRSISSWPLPHARQKTAKVTDGVENRVRKLVA